MDLELRHLRLVVAIAETGSVTKAGDILSLTQSALSHQLSDIEDRLQTRLFLRLGKRMVPTPAGEQVLTSATQVLDIVGRTERGIKRAAAAGGGVLRLSTQCYTCYHWLPGLLKDYRAAHPGVEVEVDAAATPNPIKALLDGRLNLAIMSDRVRDRRLVERTLFEDDMVVIMAPGHRLASRSYVKAEDFARETLLIYPPKEESSICQFLARAGAAPKALQQIQLSEAIIELVKADLGIAVMARWAVDPYVRAGSLRALPLTRRGFRRRWTAVVLKHAASVGYITDFITLLAKRAPAGRTAAQAGALLQFEQPRRVGGRKG